MKKIYPILSALLFFTSPLLAMELNETDEHQEKILIFPNQNQSLRSRTIKKNIRKCVLYNTASIFVLTLAGIATWGGYTYYDNLFSSCNQMKGACNDCTQEFKGLEQFSNIVTQFISQCPAEMNTFIPEVIEFLQRCCQEQP